MPVGAVAAGARADGAHGKLEGVRAGGVPEADGVGTEVDLISDCKALSENLLHIFGQYGSGTYAVNCCK